MWEEARDHGSGSWKNEDGVLLGGQSDQGTGQGKSGSGRRVVVSMVASVDHHNGGGQDVEQGTDGLGLIVEKGGVGWEKNDEVLVPAWSVVELVLLVLWAALWRRKGSLFVVFVVVPDFVTQKNF
jgi:hypothetical protein